MRDYSKELEKRVEFIRDAVKAAHAEGIVFGNSGGKDCALVGILCKKACDNTLAIQMPCNTKRNYGMDLNDAGLLNTKFGIQNMTVELTKLSDLYKELIGDKLCLTKDAAVNIAPRLRMTLLYAVARSKNFLVAGTGNRSEGYVGYFTKWGDGAYDFNPIADLTVTEIYEFLEFLECPREIIEKAPSGALFDGQTDEGELGISYKQIDDYLLFGKADCEVREKIENLHRLSQHKRAMPVVYCEEK